MKPTEQKQEFVRLRASGRSYQAIAEQVGVSKPTLLKWAVELENEIKQAQGLEFQALLESYEMSKRIRLESLLKLHKRIQAEIDRRELADIPTAKLFELAGSLAERIQGELAGVGIPTGETENILTSLLSDNRGISLSVD